MEHDVELVIAFLNTLDVEAGTDELSDADRWQRWCAGHGLAAGADLDSARAVRDEIRASVTEGEAFTAGSQWPVRIVMRSGEPTLTSDDAVGDVLSAAVRLAHTGYWNRIKICPAVDCGAAFYDRSRNRSRTWCAMRVCGNRQKARSWRERHVTS